MLPPPLDDTIRGVLLDLDGTLYQDGALIPGAREAVARLRDRYGVRFVTNTTSKRRAAVVEKLARFGIEAAADDIVSPPAVAGARLRAAGERAALFLPEAAWPDFDGVALDDAAPDWVVVGDLGEGWDFATLNRAFRLLSGGARLLALGRTRYWRAPDGLRLDAGPFVAALEAATGQTAETVGKPAPAFFHAACAALGLAPAAVALVGDDAETDVRAAQAAGLRGVLVRTGKFREADLHGAPAPNRVVDSVAVL